MIYIILIITVAYLVNIALLVKGFDKVPDFELQDIIPKTTFSVIIPFRNEEKNLTHLLNSISKLAYPKKLFEVFLVNDESSDKSLKIINDYINTSESNFGNIYMLNNERFSKSPKKDAITTAIKKAKNKWIVTSDADCKLPKYWLDSFDALIQDSNMRCLVAPVKIEGKRSFLARYQVLDFLSLQGATIGAFGMGKPFLSNGANFAYTKSLFLEVKGFDGNDEVASGDDVFLLEKIVKKYPGQINYLKNFHAIVSTTPEATWQTFINQRIRWASKSKFYKSGFAKLTGLIIFFMNALLVAIFFLSIFKVISLRTLLYVALIKFSIDFYLLFKTSSFFDQRDYMLSFIFSFIIYPFLCIYIVLKASIGGYEWRGRRFKT